MRKFRIPLTGSQLTDGRPITNIINSTAQASLQNRSTGHNTVKKQSAIKAIRRNAKNYTHIVSPHCHLDTKLY